MPSLTVQRKPGNKTGKNSFDEREKKLDEKVQGTRDKVQAVLAMFLI
jgi:hypothetical protein